MTNQTWCMLRFEVPCAVFDLPLKSQLINSLSKANNFIGVATFWHQVNNPIFALNFSMRFLFIVVLVSVLFLSGCTKDEEACVFIPDTSDIKMNVTIEQFQDSLINVESRDELVAFLTRQPIIRDYIFRRSEFPDDSVFINELYNRFNNPHLDTLLHPPYFFHSPRETPRP